MLVQEKCFRSFSIELDGKSAETPLFVPAISSTKANWTVLGYAGLIENIGYPAFLVSAYDYYKLKKDDQVNFDELISKYSTKKTLFFLDNGNYEAYWYKDDKWTIDELGVVLNSLYPDFCFSFDVFWSKNSNVETNCKQTVTAIAKTAGFQKTGSTIALFHSSADLLPELMQKVINNINPEIVAVPERELGLSILERADTIRRIRAELNNTGKKIPLHILGTGNPLSILIYTLCGADIYDALDWTSSFINHQTGLEYHFSQKDLLECNCEACRMKKVPYDYQVMAHNLIFYRTFLAKIQCSLGDGEITPLLEQYFSKKTISAIEKVAGLD